MATFHQGCRMKRHGVWMRSFSGGNQMLDLQRLAKRLERVTCGEREALINMVGEAGLEPAATSV